MLMQAQTAAQCYTIFNVFRLVHGKAVKVRYQSKWSYQHSVTLHAFSSCGVNKLKYGWRHSAATEHTVIKRGIK